MSHRLVGVSNFRSLKGAPAFGGRQIAGHAIVRSDQLHRLQDGDWAVLREMGVKTVCDLRSESERRRYPNRLPPDGWQQLSLPMHNDVRADLSLPAILRRQPDAAGASAMMMELYRRMPEALAPHLPALLGLFQNEGAPVLIHCAAGKDRTGFAVAILLHALGVPPSVILEDYMATARSAVIRDPEKREQMRRMVLHMIGELGSDELIDVILSVDERYLQTAFEALAARYGTVDEYLTHCAGVQASDLARLRDRWLTTT